eukprot:scaffold34277_cov16-Tisochrysis_lutea.AAC.1
MVGFTRSLEFPDAWQFRPVDPPWEDICYGRLTPSQRKTVSIHGQFYRPVLSFSWRHELQGQETGGSLLETRPGAGTSFKPQGRGWHQLLSDPGAGAPRRAFPGNNGGVEPTLAGACQHT